MNEPFDASRAKLQKPDLFERYRVPNQGVSLRDAGLSDDTGLMLVERRGEKRAFLLNQLIYHHLAQGELAGEPYMVSF